MLEEVADLGRVRRGGKDHGEVRRRGSRDGIRIGSTGVRRGRVDHGRVRRGEWIMEELEEERIMEELEEGGGSWRS